MVRPALEVADILRDHGSAWRHANQGHVSLGQLKVMSAIERCRTAALGGHVARCENAACGYTEIAYNSCGNRHCPKCQGAASRRWLADREGELLPVPYFHLVYTLPSELRDIAYQNKRVVYNLLMKAAAETTLTIAADPKRLGRRPHSGARWFEFGSVMMYAAASFRVTSVLPFGGRMGSRSGGTMTFVSKCPSALSLKGQRRLIFQPVDDLENHSAPEHFGLQISRMLFPVTRKLERAAIHRAPSSESPPPGTIICTCG